MSSRDPEPALVLGPLLRYVDQDSATVWVQTDAACEVVVECGAAVARTRTWSVRGRHYALAVLTGLAPGTTTPYTVRLADRTVWPETATLATAAPAKATPTKATPAKAAPDEAAPASASTTLPVRPPSVVRTLPAHPSAGRPLRIAFGSCHRAGDLGKEATARLGADALVGLARHMAATAQDGWPDALCLLGDQVYADNAPEALDGVLTRKDDGRLHATTFDQYTALYVHAWSQPDVRWLLSTVPTCMVLDDHDLRDDWNTSQAWREEVSRQPGWRDLVAGALSSYWVYQHLGNMSPAELADDPVYRAVLEAEGEEERGAVLTDHALRADGEPEAARFSYVRDFADTRLVMLDTRCSRDLRPGRRRMLDEEEWAWARARVLESDAEHILVGSSVPFLMLPGIHQLEGWNEAVTDGHWGGWWSRAGEMLRRELDLEHWPAFHLSFQAMVGLVEEVARKHRPPRTFTWLSGDVHSSYVAEAVLDNYPDSPMRLHQLVMSPFRNPLPTPVRAVKKLLGSKGTAARLHWFARRAKVDDVGVDWAVPHGPWFRNGVMTLEFADGAARVHIDHATVGADGAHRLARTRTVALT